VCEWRNVLTATKVGENPALCRNCLEGGQNAFFFNFSRSPGSCSGAGVRARRVVRLGFSDFV
jgi:hypothetical protein